MYARVLEVALSNQNQQQQSIRDEYLSVLQQTNKAFKIEKVGTEILLMGTRWFYTTAITDRG